MIKEVSCPKCKGKGSYDVEHTVLGNCPSCGGTGHKSRSWWMHSVKTNYPDHYSTACKQCGGTGFLGMTRGERRPTRTETKSCWLCQGTGSSDDWLARLWTIWHVISTAVWYALMLGFLAVMVIGTYFLFKYIALPIIALFIYLVWPILVSFFRAMFRSVF